MRRKTVSSQQLQGILGREKKVAKDMFVISVVLDNCVIQKIVVVFFSQSFGNLYPSFFLWSTTLLLLNSSITVKPGQVFQLMNLLFESCIRWQLQPSDSSLHSCMCNGRESTRDSVTKLLPT